MSAIASSASDILVQWQPPLYPNGPISRYAVCYNYTECSNAEPTATSYTLPDLTSQLSYIITVQPVTVFEGVTLVGTISEEITVSTNTQSNVTGDGGTNDRGTTTLRVELPNYRDFGGEVV